MIPWCVCNITLCGAMPAHLIFMADLFLDVRSETPALRRIVLLLERLHEETAADKGLQELEEVVASMHQAGLAGRPVPARALEELMHVLTGLPPPCPSPGCGAVCALLRANVLAETRDLLPRLSSACTLPQNVRQLPSPVAVGTRAS